MKLNFLAILGFLSLLSGTTSFSQAGVISGVVRDKTDNHPIEFATVTLFNDLDSAMVTGMVTDTSGQFLLEKIPAGNYYLRIGFIGYLAEFISDVNISPSQPVVAVPTVLLNLSADLAAVEIMGEKNVFENRIDKKVFNADQNLTSKGGTGLDLLRQIPTITVDESDNILLRGDGNVTVLIDGRPSSMPANQLLKQLPASAIERVEIITNPSAKYDPEGMSGIINIVLKKSKLEGFNGSVNATLDYGAFWHANGTLSLNYRKNKFNLTSTYSYFYDQTWFGGSLDRNVFVGDTIWDRLRSEDYGERLNTYHSARVGLDYFANDNNTFYVTANADYGTNLGNRLIRYDNVGEANELLYFSERNGYIDAPSSNYVFTGGWQKTFKKPDHTLFIDFNYSNLNFEGDEDLWQKYYDEAAYNYTTTYQHTLDKTYNQTFLAKADYVLPITDSLTLEAGFHFTQRIADNGFFSESAAADQVFTTDVGLTNQFKFLQNTFAPYATLARQWKKLGAKIGLRAEPTVIKAELVTTNQKFDQEYYQLFPSAHFSYTTERNSEFYLSYSRRINRPELEQLNPFTNYSDPLVLETGNPFLRPEIIHVNELSYTKYWKKFNINSTVYYRLITDLIRRALFFDGIYSTVTNSNLGKSNLTGGDLILTYMPIKGMRLVSSTSVWNTATKDPSVTDGTYQNFTGMYTSLMASYRMENGWSFQAWGSYAPRTKVIQGAILPNYGGGFAIQKNLLKNKATLNFSVYDVLKTRWFAFESTDLGNYKMTSKRYWESRHFSLSFTYNFGKLTEGKERRQNSSGGIDDNLNVPISQ